MKRRAFITLLGGAAAWPLAVRAQQRPMAPPIGILEPGLAQHFEAFRRGMDDFGYVEGRSVSYIYRTAADRAESVSGLPPQADLSASSRHECQKPTWRNWLSDTR